MHRIARCPRRLGRSLALPGGSLALLAVLLLASAVGQAFGQACTPQERPLVIPLNSAKRFQMSSRKAIRTVVNPKETVLAIRTIDRDPTTILLVGTAPGLTTIELEDVDGFRESKQVLVQADVEYLKRELKKALPQSNITVTPAGASSVVLGGTVNRIEEANVALQLAAGLNFQPINNLRLPGVQQVQLDVVIARVRRLKIRNFGFNFLQNSRRQIFGSTLGGLLPTIPASPVGTGVPQLILQPTQIGQVIASPPGATNLFGGLISNNAGFLFFLQALENEGLAKILVQPRLVTKSGQPASLLDGGEQAVPVPAGLGQVGVQFEEFGTRLNFLPIILGNGRIYLEVEPEVSTLDPNAGVVIAGATVPGRNTQRIHTTVEMESGQTYVIGGLIQKLNTGTTFKVPVIGQLPFLGAAFSTKTFNEEETELVVLVTPHLVDAQSACQVVKVLPGEESRTPDDFELFLEGILEAPRGPRAVIQGGRYVPAHLTGPTAGLLPCAGKNDGFHACSHDAYFGGRLGGLKGAGCGTGACSTCGPMPSALSGGLAAPPGATPPALTAPPPSKAVLPASLPGTGLSRPATAPEMPTTPEMPPAIPSLPPGGPPGAEAPRAPSADLPPAIELPRPPATGGPPR